jgi:RNA polymerase sigma-70 factor (ECF subfamily)
MFFHKMTATVSGLLTVGLISTGVAVWAEQRPAATLIGEQDQGSMIQDATIAAPSGDRVSIAAAMLEPGGATEGGPDFEIDPNLGELDDDETSGALKYNDGSPDGKRSLGGSGEMIEFSGPSASNKITGVRIHGSRYGNPQPPKESFLIYFLSGDQKRILHTEMAPYSVFERGDEKWVDVKFERPVELPKEFWVVLDFRAQQTKGVYVSFDTSSGGKHSRAGLPGIPSSPVRIGGDWMIEVIGK